jgi:hypothetical protein
MSGAEASGTNTATHTADTPQLLLEHHLKELRLHTILRDLLQRFAQPTGTPGISLHNLRQMFSKYMVSTVFCLTEEPADAKLNPNRYSFPGKIVQSAKVSAMSTPGCLLALRTDTPRTGRAKNHHDPALFFDHQLIMHHLTGIRHQCPLSHRHPPETARAHLLSIATPALRKVSGVVHQM